MKIKVSHIAAVGIIFTPDFPFRVFVERKTDDYPVKVFAGTLCLPGGNWVGEAAKTDASPSETLRRELMEEFHIAASETGADEMVSLGLNAGTDGRDLQKGTQAAAGDIECFDSVVESMLSAITPFMDALITVPKTLFDSADPENKRGDTTFLVSYFTIPVEWPEWSELNRLQNKYGNLSNESETLMITFDEICRDKTKVSWGHDCALDAFCRKYVAKAGIPLLEGIQWQDMGAPLSSYDEYKEKYEIVKQP